MRFSAKVAVAMEALSRAQPACEVGLNICVFLFLPILVLASKGAAPLVGVAGACALCIAVTDGADAWRRVHGWAALFVVLVLLGVSSSLWAVNAERSLLIALRLTGIFVAGLSLAAASSKIAAPRLLMMFFIAGMVVAFVLAALQGTTHGALTAPFSRRPFSETALNQAENAFALLLLPLSAMLVLRRNYAAAVALAVLSIAAISLLAGDTGKLAAAVGFAVAAGFYWRRRALARVAAALSVVLIAVAPLTLPQLASNNAAREVAQGIKFSAWHRLEIWSFVGGKIAEKPVLGWGLDSSRAIPGGDVPIPDVPALLHETWLPLHPHNAALQLWLELGAPGAILLAIFVAGIWLALGKVPWPRLYAAAASGATAATLTVALGSYGIWQEWLLASEFLTAFLILVMARLAQPMPEASR